MKVSRIEWADCPHCGIRLNEYNCYPASILMYGNSNTGSYFKCSACDKKVIMFCRVTLKFEALKDEENELG